MNLTDSHLRVQACHKKLIFHAKGSAVFRRRASESDQDGSLANLDHVCLYIRRSHFQSPGPKTETCGLCPGCLPYPSVKKVEASKRA